MRYSTAKLLFFLLFQLLSFHTFSKERLDFSFIGANEGLSENIVNDIVQDKKGFIWLATNDGLNRYDGYRMSHFRYDPSNPNSLTSNVLTALLVDKNGMIWIGTSDGGLNKYNPQNNTFERFQNKTSELTSITEGMIDEIAEDVEGNIWLNIRNKGIDRVQIKEDRIQFVHYTAPGHSKATVSVLKNNTTTSIQKCSAGGVWISSENGIQHLDAKNKQADNLIAWGNYATAPVKQIIETSHHTIWIVYSNGQIINGQLKSNHLIPISTFTVNPFQGKVTLDIDQQQILWVSSANGLLKISSKGVVTYQSGRLPLNNLPTNRILSTFVDKSNVLWLGTYNNGALNFSINRQLFYTFDDLLINNMDKSNSFFNNAVQAVCEDKTGALWIGSEGGGLVRIGEGLNAFLNKDKKSEQHLEFFNANNTQTSWLLDNNIYCLYFDSKNRLWIGSGEGLTQLTFTAAYTKGANLSTANYKAQHFVLKGSEHKVFGEGAVFSINEDKFGTIWAAKWNGGLHRFLETKNEFEGFYHDPANPKSISHNTVRCMLFDKNGEAWIGTAGGGLNKMIFPKGPKGTPQFLRYKNDPKDGASLSNNYILNLSKDKNGNLWIGTFGGGLNKLEKSNLATNDYTFKRYTIQEQLPSNTIKGLLFDKKNNLWASTNRELFRLNVKSDNVTQIISSASFKLEEFKDNANYLFKNGYMLWAGINGLVVFSPDMSEHGKQAVNPCFTNIVMDGKAVMAGESIEGNILFDTSIQHADGIVLPYNKNTIELQFSGMNYANIKGLVYRYFLDGYDNAPVISSSPTVRYTKIPHGKYKFKLQASNDGVNWTGKEIVLNVTVKPPFWLSTYAFLFYIFFFVTIGYSVFRILVFRIKMQGKIKIEKIKTEQAENINNLKLQFFTNISHELRTPLNLIINPIDSLVADSDLSERQQKMLKLVQHNSNRLQKLINQLLDFRKMESGVKALSLVNADVVMYISTIYKAFQEIAASKQIDFSFQSEETSIQCLFDPDKIEKILYNLLSNAMKFTPANGAVKLLIRREVLSDGAPNLVIEVVDNGIGIKQADQDKIFQYFYQSEQNKSEKNVGTGIGLAYIYNLCKVHHGNITMKSEVGSGTKFTVTLPLNGEIYKNHSVGELTELTQREALQLEISDLKVLMGDDKTPAANNKKAKDKPNLLVVDDNEELLSYLSIELSDDYNILTALNGQLGIDAAKEHLPDLIISDLMMPVMDGIEMCSILKIDLETCHIPIIILTAKADEGSEKEGLETGADEYLLKPFKTEILRLRIKNLLGTKTKLFKQFSLESGSLAFKQATDSKDREMLEKVSKMIVDSLDTVELDSELLSQKLGMSRSALYKNLKRITDMSTTEYVRYVKLNEAVQLFKQNKYTIEQVTFMVGFSDTKYFRKCFRAVFDKSPSEYIKELKNSGE